MNSCPVDIWTISLDAPRPLSLTPEEQTRANRFRFERDRLHWSHARSALRAVLARYLNKPPQHLGFLYGEYGKPALADGAGLEFNISHSHGWAMIAVTREIPVGIDIEAIREKVDIAKLLQRLGETELTGSTWELFHVWTRREARTKAVGGSLMEIPAGDLRVIDVHAPETFAASVCLAGCDPEPRYQTE